MKLLKTLKTKRASVFLIVIGAVISIGLYFILVGNMTDVLVINQTVRGGTQITDEMISVKKADKSSLPNDYISADLKNKVIGQYFDLGLTKGGVLTKDNLSLSGKASLIKEGLILYSLKDLETYPKGLVAGDNLNIVVATSDSGDKYVKTIESVPVAAVHTVEGEISGIEIYVTPESAQLIAFAQANGEVSVGLLPLNYQNKNLEVLIGENFLHSQSDTE